jgi:LacI family transcriptional regulator
VNASTRVTLRDVGKKAGVSHVTVSLALRNDRTIPPATRERIQALAEKMGYRPDPALSALVAYRRGVRPSTYGGTLIWLYNQPTRDGERYIHSTNDYFAGASERATQLGYTLEKLWLREPGVQRRADKVLATRNIRGLLLPPQPRTRAHLHLDWSRYSALSLGYTLTYPPLHTVFFDHFRSMVQLIRRVRSLGYRRIGLVLPADVDARSDFEWSSAFLHEQRRLNSEDHIPPLVPKTRKGFTENQLFQWLNRYHPSILLTFYYSNIPEWLKKRKIRIPEDIGLAAPYIPLKEKKISGIQGNSHLIGQVAMNFLVDMLHRNETGIPDSPRRLLVEGKWSEGETVRRVTK